VAHQVLVLFHRGMLFFSPVGAMLVAVRPGEKLYTRDGVCGLVCGLDAASKGAFAQFLEGVDT